MYRLILSRRNLEVLLSKLDRVKTGEFSACTIIKSGEDAQGNSVRIIVSAAEDNVVYADRPAGIMHPSDVKEVRHQTGEGFQD